MMRISKTLLSGACPWFALLLLLTTLRSSSGQPRADMPSAEMAIEDPVPFALVQQIAAGKARQVWGEGSLGPAIPLSDENGRLTAWMFPYSIGSSRFPDRDAVLRQVRDGRKLRELAQSSSSEEVKRLHRQLIVRSPRQPEFAGGGFAQMDPVRSDGTISRRAQGNERTELQRYAARKAIGAGEYGTVVVSASYRQVPVPVYSFALSPYYTRFEEAQQKARARLGEGAVLRRVYFLGAEGHVFEFAGDGETVSLHAETLRETGPMADRRRPQGTAREAGNTDAVRQHTARLWADIQRELVKN